MNLRNKNILKYSLSHLILLIGIIRCEQAAENKGRVVDAKYTIDVSDVEGADMDSMSNYIKRVQFVPLETAEESLLNGVRQIAVSDDHIYILDDRYAVKIFDLKGEYVGDVGGQGKGPGEYNQANQIHWNPAQKSIYVSDFRQGKIIQYDAFGKFINEVPINFSMSRIGSIISLDNGGFLIKEQKLSAEDSASVLLLDAEGKEIRKYFTEETIYTDMTSGDYTLFRVGYRLFYLPYYSDIIYEFDQEKSIFLPYVFVKSPFKRDLRKLEEIELKKLDFSRKSSIYSEQKEFNDAISNEYKSVLGISYFYETDEFLTFQFKYGGGSYANPLLDKATGTVLIGTPIPLPAFPQIPIKDGIVQNIVWQYDPERSKELMIDLIKDTANDKEIEQIRSLTIEDNPVLAFYYFN